MDKYFNTSKEEKMTHSKTEIQMSGSNITENDLINLKRYPYLEKIDLSSSNIPDDWLTHIEGFSHLKAIMLKNTNISDAGLCHLKNLTSLVLLDLSNSKISNTGLKYLEKLTELIYLDLSKTSINDTALTHLKNMSGLEYLDLNRTKVNGTRLAQLKHLKNLTNLNLDHTNISDNELIYVQDLQSIKYLSLNNTKISNTGLKQIKALLHLESLSLNNTNVSKQGISHLKNLGNLKLISLENTSLTNDEILSLESDFPDCHFHPDSKRIIIESISEKAVEAISNSDWANAKMYGDYLSKPNLKSIQNKVQNRPVSTIDTLYQIEHWITIYEARNKFDKAAQYADVSIALLKQNFINSISEEEYGDANIKSDLEFIFVMCEFQAIRYFNLNEIDRAKNVMKDALELSKKYGISLDKDQQELVEEFELI